MVFSRTQGFRHDSIPEGIRAVEEIARRRGWSVTATEDPTVFSSERLRGVDVIVFLLTSGDILGGDQEAALASFLARGGGIAGVHSATDTEYDWPVWGQLFGTYFSSHPPGTPTAQLTVVERAHPATRPLPPQLTRADEWYTFRHDPAIDGATRVLVTVDGASTGGTGHQPISWSRLVLGGRVFYTGMGHTRESYQEPPFLAHLEGGIAWAAGQRDPGVLIEELDGTHPAGAWDPHGPVRDFTYHVRKDGLEMEDRGGANQHLTRRGVLVDHQRPYAVDTLFTIQPDRPGAAPGLGSFCINFAVQGRGGSAEDLERLSAHAMNLDVGDGTAPGGVLKHMGFVDGAFRQIGERRTGCCRAGVEYRLRVDVNADDAGNHRPRLVTVTLAEGATVHERFTVDYAAFPWQPKVGQPVRIGVNTHGASWLMRHLRVHYLD
jgi:type 1 glutamine amidotransferase